MVKIFDTCQNISKQMLKNFYSCQNNSAYAWIFYVMTRIGHDWNMAMTNMQIKVIFLSRKHISYCCQNLKNHHLYKILKNHQFLSNFEKSSIFFQILKNHHFGQFLKINQFLPNFEKIIIFCQFLKNHHFCRILRNKSKNCKNVLSKFENLWNFETSQFLPNQLLKKS